MKLILAVNIGTEDNKRFRIAKPFEGETIDVDKAIGEFLLKRGWASESSVETLKADPPKVDLQTSGTTPKAKANA